jgi:hypothetical protein
MPTASNFESLEEVMDLIHQQALGYLQIYRELHGSDWSRQHSALYAAVDSRTFKGRVDLSLLTDVDGNVISYDEFISNTPDIFDIINRINAMLDDNQPTEYAKLGNTILKTLFESVDTKYLADNAGASVNRFKKLKELFISLCSYNIAFLEGNVGADDTTMTFPGYVTQDIVNVVHGLTSFEYLNSIVTRGFFNHHIVEKFDHLCVDVSTGKEVMNTPIPMIADVTDIRIVHDYPLCVHIRDIGIKDDEEIIVQYNTL